MNRKKIKRGPGKQRIEGKQFRLAREINYIQRRAAAYDARFVTVGPLVFFSTQTGDAWMLDPSDRLAARLAREAKIFRRVLICLLYGRNWLWRDGNVTNGLIKYGGI